MDDSNPKAAFTVVLLRHGESEWNKENRFTGWVDVGLSAKGQEEARAAGRSMAAAGLAFDLAYTSYLKRAQETLRLAEEGMGCGTIPEIKAWQLNERHYGALQGLNKSAVREQYGEEKFMEWHRSYDIAPPPIVRGSEYDVTDDPRYAGLPPGTVPRTESLRDVERRLMPYWNSVIVPMVTQGKRVIIAAHGNSLRALIKNLDHLSPEQIVAVEIPVGVPLVYTFDAAMNVQDRRYLPQ